MQPKINWVNCMLIASNGIGDNDNWMMEKQWAKKQKKKQTSFRKKLEKNKSLYALVLCILHTSCYIIEKIANINTY